MLNLFLVFGLLAWTLWPSPITASALRIGEHELAPVTHTLFCDRYEQECRPAKASAQWLLLSEKQKLLQLSAVNSAVNRKIQYVPNLRGLAGEKWQLWPARGNCNDYAVTKRHELIALGWPSENVLLAEVTLPSGEHHLIVVAKLELNDQEMVLDNMRQKVMSLSETSYQWIRMQSTKNPKFWDKIAAAR